MLWEWPKDRSSFYILDLDGTLMPSAEIDNQCFWEAVFAYFDGSYSIPDLHGFKDVTDTGILNEWCIREFGRPPRPKETQEIKQKFLQRLESAANQNPAHFSPLPGVTEWLEAVGANSHVYAAIATGGWRRSAHLKLRLSGLDQFQLPVASSDDAVSRVDIMKIAVKRAMEQQAGIDPVITYVGDGVWDLQASQTLDWGFIGIANKLQEDQLRRAGASQIYANFVISQ